MVAEFGDKSRVKDILLWAFVLIIWAILRARSPPKIIEQGADYYFGIFLFLYFMGKYIAQTGKYKTPMFIANGIHGSCSCRPVIVGDWALFRLGGIKWGLFFRGNDSSVLVPKKSVTKLGENWFSIARVERINLNQTPYKCQKVMEALNYNEDFVYVGYATEEFEIRNEDFIDLEREVENLQDVISTFKKAMKGKYSAIESQVAWLDRLKGRKPKTMQDKLTEEEET